MISGARIDVIDILRRGLQAATLKHRVLADNIANADTPGFKRSDVAFCDVMKEAVEARRRLPMVTTHIGHSAGRAGALGEARALTVSEGGSSQRPDGNNVDIEREMAELASNTLYYDALSQQINSKLSMIRTAVNEGRR